MPQASTPRAHYGSLPFNEQITFFRDKLNLPSERWADVWQSAHNGAFSVAGAMKDDLLNDFRRAVDAAIADGKSLNWFRREFDAIVAKHGWQHTGSAAWRSKVIFDTNMRQSYNAGRYEQLQQFDYWRYAHGDSRYPREIHLKWHDTILPKSDPWWRSHFPQNGWGCKCRIYGVSQRELERRGLSISQRPEDGSREWTDKVTGEVHQVPKGIDPGFDYTPMREVNVKRLALQAEQKAVVYQAPERIVPSSFSTVNGVSNAGLNNLLQQIKQTSSAPQIEQLGQFLAQHEIKSLFIKQAEMGANNRGASAIAQSVTQYIDAAKYQKRYQPKQLFTHTNARKSWGFTSKSFDHVVIKVGATTRLANVDVNELRRIIPLATKLLQDGARQHTLSHIARSVAEGKHNTGTVITWLHELGHQVHFKAGSPQRPYSVGITNYSMSNHYEWHAEHFAAWVLNRRALLEFNSDIATYFDELMAKVLLIEKGKDE